MATITIDGITGGSPYNITVCDGFGNNCVYFPSLTTPPFTLSLPSIYDTAPITMVTMTDSSGCSRMELFYCDDVYPEELCFTITYEDILGGTIEYPIVLTKDENINNLPSYVGTFTGSPLTMYWNNTNWVLDPYGYTSIGPDLFYGIWGYVGDYYGSLSNTYCPSVCIFADDGVAQLNIPLQYTIYNNYPPGNFLTAYQDIISNVSIEWNSATTQWEYYELSVLQATLPGSETITPIGVWNIETGSTYTNIVTSYVCQLPGAETKQFQNSNYFFFMDSLLYSFQN